MPRPTVLALRGSSGTPGLGAAAWAACLAAVAAWPADQLVSPVVERRIARRSAGEVEETVLLALQDPFGMLDASAALRELHQLAAPLVATCSLEELDHRAAASVLADVPRELCELLGLSPLIPEGAHAMPPLIDALVTGLLRQPGRCSLSMLVAPANEFAARHGDEQVLRGVRFRTRLASDFVIPSALRSTAEALCLATRPPSSAWHCASGAREREALRSAGRRVALYPWAGQVDPVTTAGAAVALLTLTGFSEAEPLGDSADARRGCGEDPPLAATGPSLPQPTRRL